jgi:ADP-ribosylglycohydrolase
MTSPSPQDRILGSLFGAALGDAMAAPLEFLGFDSIMARYPNRAKIPPGRRVTDDTQMMLAVGDALIAARGQFEPATLEHHLRKSFVDWYRSPDNNRAPGVTCMSACGRLQQGLPWVEATAHNSKGCGANMRVTPVGLLLHTDDATRSGVAQLQAALTHGHPTGILAADLTAQATFLLASGRPPRDLICELHSWLERFGTNYDSKWLSTIWQRPDATTPEEFLARGRLECERGLDAIDAALESPDLTADPCLATGEGWIAEEAFATGLLCFLLFPDDPVAAIRHASATQGDSDSIACLTGAFAGAANGLHAWPRDWVETIEYHDRLLNLGVALAAY